MSKICFTKMNAGGNDFVIIDNRQKVMKETPALIKEICARKRGVGADGLILWENSEIADLKMKYYNPDGKEVSMCGNGARCVSKFVHLKGIISHFISLETKAGIYKAEVKEGSVKLALVEPTGLRLDFPLSIKDKIYKVHFLNTGVPHVIMFVSDLNSVDVYNLGKEIRYHKEFQSEGTNADFVQVWQDNKIKIRTYERGVEEETLACGTGAVAGVLIASLIKGINSPVEVYTQGGDVLEIYFNYTKGKFSQIYLEGETKVVYEGEIELCQSISL